MARKKVMRKTSSNQDSRDNDAMDKYADRYNKDENFRKIMDMFDSGFNREMKRRAAERKKKGGKGGNKKKK